MRIAMLGMVTLIAASATIAQAAELPNFVGTWNEIGPAAAAHIGKGAHGYVGGMAFNTTKPLSLVIEKQEGRGFAGYLQLSDGYKDPFAGVVKHNGQEALLSGDHWTGTIDVDGSDIEFCVVDSLPDEDFAHCRYIQKAP